ncbi:MAG: hypothetical protein HQM13_21750 [SAR324 cluster bacterium]|nr:hypothetical protein [SAR324 cluster bacterium]
MKRLIQSALLLIVAVGLFSTLEAQETIKIGMIANYKNDELKLSTKTQTGYRQSMKISECPPLDSPLLKESQRSTMELMFVCHALKNADLGENFVLVPYPNPKRSIIQVEQDQIHIDGGSKFRKALEGKNLLLSDALLRKGEFVVGLFSTRNRPEVLKIKSLPELRQYVGVTVKTWKMDREVMEQLGLKKVRFVGKGIHIARSIQEKKADFTFSFLKEKVVSRVGGELLRIDGLKASLPDERVFLISPRQKALFEAIQHFIKVSREPEDLIKKAYIHSGFIAADYENWIDVRLAK